MRVARCYLKDSGVDQVFHVVSRVVDRRYILGEGEKQVFLGIMRQAEGFSGVRILTYCLMDNHFHILVRVPRGGSEDLSDAEVFERMAFAYSRERVESLEKEVIELRRSGLDERADRMISAYRRRMNDLSEFVKMLKQRFTQWYNRENQRSGTLWEERFKCYLVEGRLGSLKRVAAYIDLNPVRAGMVCNALKYRWNGIGEAMRGVRSMRAALGSLVDSGRDFRTAEHYFQLYSSYLEEVSRKEYSKLRERKMEETGGPKPSDSGSECVLEGVRLIGNGLAVGRLEFISEVSKRLVRSDHPRCSEKNCETVDGHEVYFLRSRRRRYGLESRDHSCVLESR